MQLFSREAARLRRRQRGEQVRDLRAAFGAKASELKQYLQELTKD